LPPQFFAFHEQVQGLKDFLVNFPPPPPVGPGTGPIGPPDPNAPPFPPGPFPPGPFPGLAFVEFDDVKDFLPPTFLPPEDAVAFFDSFGQDHPLIGENGAVNPELESALFQHPPVPMGFTGFDFHGDCPQFDDLFTRYNEEMIGQTMRGQVNSTLEGMLPDGKPLQCSETTVIESVQGEATPLIQMAEGVFQTQWVVNIRELRSTQFFIVDPTLPDGGTIFQQTAEILSQMTWTMLLQDVDLDGDGITDEVQVTGSNVIEILEENIEGEAPPDAPPPPPLLLPLEFEGVLQTDASAPSEEESIEDQPAVEDQENSETGA